ncbi:MAG: DUF1801 domain-containing protein [Candidatus Cloacimonetes bacterium]|nr:DUF1801 domain-containing protein [Candidatus Cloacimonadota bacterium]
MNTEFQSYIDSREEEFRNRIMSFHDIIMEMYPGCDQKIWFNILSYRMEKGWTGWVGLGYWKEGVTLYTGAIPLITVFRQKHPGIKTGKGCINFKIKDAIPWQEVRQVIRFAMEPDR